MLLLFIVCYVLGFATFWALAYAKFEKLYSRKMQIGRLEAAMGVPLVMNGECRNCHAALVAGAHFCHYCRTPVEVDPRLCPHCGERNPEASHYCHLCGAVLPALPHLPAPQVPGLDLVYPPQRATNMGPLKARPLGNDKLKAPGH